MVQVVAVSILSSQLKPLDRPEIGHPFSQNGSQVGVITVEISAQQESTQNAV